MFAQLVVSGLAIGSLYGLVGLSLVLVYIAVENVNFAQGEMAMITTFIAFTLIKTLGVNYWLAVPITLLAALIFGVVFETVVIKPVANADHTTVIIVTLGVYVAMHSLAGLIWGHEVYKFPAPVTSEAFTVAGIAVSPVHLFALGVAMIVSLILYFFFKRTDVGIAIRASASDKVSARLMGISPRFVSVFAWGLGSVLGSLAALTIAPISFLDTNMMMSFFLKAMAAAILGGITSMPGALIGGLILGVTENLVGGYISSGFKDSFAFVVIILILLIKPTGLFSAPGQRSV